MLMLQVCSPAPRHAYELCVEKLTTPFPDAWHWARDGQERTTLQVEKINLDSKDGKPGFVGYDDKEPWDAVFKIVPSELKFWQDQIHTPALTWMASGARGKAMTPQEAIAQASTVDGAWNVRDHFTLSNLLDIKAGEQGAQGSKGEEVAGRKRRTSTLARIPRRLPGRSKTKWQRK